jgi:uncharacterized membrane protein YgcG
MSRHTAKLLEATGIVAALLALTIAPPAAAGQVVIECGEYLGVVCQGYFTDEPGVATDHDSIEDAIDRLVARYGNPIALVVVTDSRGREPEAFAEELANEWGVGDPVAENGILVLVSLNERRTEVVVQDNVAVPGDVIAGSARSFFAAGDFQGGLNAIVGTLEQALAGNLAQPETEGVSGTALLAGLVAVLLLGLGVVVFVSRKARVSAVEKKRRVLVDAELARLEVSGDEIPSASQFAVAPPGEDAAATTGAVVAVLDLEQASGDKMALIAAWQHQLLIVVDRDQLIAQTREPLELRASDERPLLEDAVQSGASDALEVSWRDDPGFDVALGSLGLLVDSLRPHRVAAARRRMADTLASSAVDTAVGPAVLTRRGDQVLRAAPALDADSSIEDSLAELERAGSRARQKVDRLEALYERLPSSTARPAVAAALADVDDDLDAASARYEVVRTRLEREGTALEADGLDTAAIAALLLMNNDADNVSGFVAAYSASRDLGYTPQESVEHALAGLMTAGEIKRVRTEAARLGIPVSIMSALLRRRDDGPEVYRSILDELAGEVGGETARTIAGVLAVSLEPSQAVRRWLEARRALAALGLTGSYADVAAAFGASHAEGPRAFAVAYAAQREALADSTIDDADRFAPELAHDGTAGGTDSWTRDRIPSRLGAFDPFTLFYYHWVITRGHAGSYGWEPIYRDRSWSEDRSSWWGGGGGFGSSGGSSWGGSSWGGGGGFSGWSGGGGFSGGGGGSW